MKFPFSITKSLQGVFFIFLFGCKSSHPKVIDNLWFWMSFHKKRNPKDCYIVKFLIISIGEISNMMLFNNFTILSCNVNGIGKVAKQLHGKRLSLIFTQ